MTHLKSAVISDIDGRMAHLFDKMISKSRSKSSFEAVTKLTSALEKLSDNSPEKLQEDISKFLTLIKVYAASQIEAIIVSCKKGNALIA